MDQTKENKLQLVHDMIADFSKETILTPELLQNRRERILQLEQAISANPNSLTMDEYNPGNIRHHFGSGVYGRELFLHKDTVVVSKIHKNKTFNIIAKGLVSVIDPVNGYNTYQGPYTFVSEPMTKRVVIAHEDTLWITTHANENDSEDLLEIEDKTIAESFENLIEKKENLCLGGQPE